VTLEPEQEDLLVTLVEAWRSTPRSERHEFVLVRTSGPDIIIGLSGGQLNGTYYVDVLTLVDAGFLNRIPSKRDLHFILTERGFQFYDELKHRTGEPTRQVEAEPDRTGVRAWLENNQGLVATIGIGATIAVAIILAIWKG
jgi:hypothetical protein